MDRKLDTKDLLAGVVFVALGAGFLIIGEGYAFGEARRMGPGYFPKVLAGILVGLGVLVIFRGLRASQTTRVEFAWKPLLINIAALALFGLLIIGGGLVPAVIVATLVSAASSARFRIVPTLMLAVGLTAFTHLTFVKGLGLPIQPFGTWFGN